MEVGTAPELAPENNTGVDNGQGGVGQKWKAEGAEGAEVEPTVAAW